jgi:ABC-type sugar transport system substrate-binding protein
LTQNDAMAIGVRKALKEAMKDWFWLPLTGVDGLPSTGQRWVQEGLRTKTVVVPTNADIALRILKQAMTTKLQPAELTFTKPESYPDLGKLSPPSKRSDQQRA